MQAKHNDVTAIKSVTLPNNTTTSLVDEMKVKTLMSLP